MEICKKELQRSQEKRNLILKASIVNLKNKKMKQTMVICLCAVIACNSEKKTGIQSFIPGTYVKPISNEYAKGNDTLTINMLSNEGNNYEVVKHSAFHRIVNHKPLSLENKTEVWTCIFKQDEKVLYETTKGKVISFIPERNALRIGSGEYKKLDPFAESVLDAEN
jgi:hypothetical protein